MNLRPIHELSREHVGRVILLDVKQWRHCKGQMGRPWFAEEDPSRLEWLAWVGFTHFVELSELEKCERADMESRFGKLTASEEEYLAEKYGAAVNGSETQR